MAASTLPSFATATPAIRAAMLWADAVRHLAGERPMHTAGSQPPELAALLEGLRREDPTAEDAMHGWIDQASAEPAALAIVAERLRFCMWNDTRLDDGQPAMAYLQPKGYEDPDGRLCMHAFEEIIEESEARFSLSRQPHASDPGEAMADLYSTLEGLGIEFDPELQAQHEEECPGFFDASFSSLEVREEAMPKIRASREAREISAAAGIAGRSAGLSPSI